MDGEIVGDLLSLARNLVSLLEAREREKALERVHAAHRQHALRSYEVRSEVVHGINLAVHRLRRERDRVRAAVQMLPEGERLFAETQIEPILDDIFNQEIASLLTAKRRWSGPR